MKLYINIKASGLIPDNYIEIAEKYKIKDRNTREVILFISITIFCYFTLKFIKSVIFPSELSDVYEIKNRKKQYRPSTKRQIRERKIKVAKPRPDRYNSNHENVFDENDYENRWLKQPIRNKYDTQKYPRQMNQQYNNENNIQNTVFNSNDDYIQYDQKIQHKIPFKKTKMNAESIKKDIKMQNKLSLLSLFKNLKKSKNQYEDFRNKIRPDQNQFDFRQVNDNINNFIDYNTNNPVNYRVNGNENIYNNNNYIPQNQYMPINNNNYVQPPFYYREPYHYVEQPKYNQWENNINLNNQNKNRKVFLNDIESDIEAYYQSYKYIMQD